jgi:predicted dehydrogenase
MKRRELVKMLGLGGLSLPWLIDAAPDMISSKTYQLPSLQSLSGPNRKITAIVLGAGARGNTYGGYALAYPAELDFVGVAEPIPFRREKFRTAHGIQEDQQFVTWEHVFERPKFADVIVITTPDHLHHGPAMQALAMGYDLLLEKPIAQTWRECKEFLDQQRKYNNIVAVCHVLRYAPY